MLNLPLQLVIDGVSITADLADEPIVRAAINSLFTWRRADADDALPGNHRFGWWGDALGPVSGERWGSRLWLLSRSALTDETVLRAKGYAEEALAWLVEDGVAQTVEVQAERQGLDRLALSCLIVRGNGTATAIRFADVWRYLQ